MSAQILPFDFEEQAVRVVMRADDPWFVAADVCRVLELANRHDAVGRLDDDERDAVGISDSIGRNQKMTIINESGLYALVLTSRKDQAKRFRKWITAEVLPAIRKHGRYDHHLPATGGTVLEGDSQRDAEIWLSMIREARLLGGTKAGRLMWEQSPLPPLISARQSASGPTDGPDCLAHLLRFIVPDTDEAISDIVARALDGDAGAADCLTRYGMRCKDPGLFVTGPAHDGLAEIFTGTPWAFGVHRATLLSLPGACPGPIPYTLAGVAARGVLVPWRLFEERSAA